MIQYCDVPGCRRHLELGVGGTGRQHVWIAQYTHSTGILPSLGGLASEACPGVPQARMSRIILTVVGGAKALALAAFLAWASAHRDSW